MFYGLNAISADETMACVSRLMYSISVLWVLQYLAQVKYSVIIFIAKLGKFGICEDAYSNWVSAHFYLPYRYFRIHYTTYGHVTIILV